MENKFAGKRALVTGAGQGMGREIAIELAKQGASVTALSLIKEDLESLKVEMPQIEILPLDISNWSETETAVKKVGAVDLLVNNAGITALEEVGKITEKNFDALFAVNVKAVVNISQTVANRMKEEGIQGSIVNISSQASLIALDKHTVYGASKAAVDQLTKVMALELGPYGIRVNCINPTVVMTDMGKKVWGNGKKADDFKAKIPLGKFAEVEDIVKAVLFLLSDDSRMITGVQLPVDGGYIIQ